MSIKYTEAKYTDPGVEQGRGNPTIEALNPPQSDKEIMKALLKKPRFTRPDPKLPVEKRRQELAVLDQAYSPIEPVVALARSYDDVLRCGYHCRNPMKIGYFDHTAKQWCEGREKRAHQSVTGISACGEAGLGKSVAMKLIPEGQPQVIQHTQYTPPQYLKAKQLPGLQHLQKKQPFPHVQIVYLHVQCPVNSRKPSNMARAIFAAADEILDGTNYRDKYGHGTMTDLELNAAILAKNHSLGVLIIDEIQRLVKSEETMNFLIDLNNIIGVPIVSIGTEQSIALFKGNGSVARRGNKMGDHHWKRMLWSDEKDRKNWNNFMKVLWPHQVVQHMVEFDESLSKLFWQQCRGIPDYGVKLFRLAQCRAMESGVEKLTPEVIISATDNFSFSQEILAADKK